jgi:putative ABC transport system permease protein
MMKNYFKIAWRNITAQKFYSLINIIGLSAGIAFTFLMAAYVWQELQVNKNLSNADSQYIIQSKWKNPNMGLELTTLGPLAKALKEEYPHLVANYYRWDGITSVVSRGDKIFREGLQIGDSTFLNMYGFELLHGDKRTAFNNPFSVVITSDVAKKYFGKTDVTGQAVTIENFSGLKHDFLITGVLKKASRNSITSINDDNFNHFFLALKDLSWFGRDINQWANPYVVGYVQLQKGIQPGDLETPMRQLLKTNVSPDVAVQLQPFLVPLKEYYLAANNGVVKRMLYTVSFVSLFILMMAIVNFINLSIGHSSGRMKEIGIRKVLGSLRRQLVLQFLAESFLLVAISTVLSLIVYELLRNWFGSLVERTLPSLAGFTWMYWIVPLVVIVFLGSLSGLYPAMVLSAIKSADAVKGKFNSVKEKVGSRKLLVGFQFATALFVLIAAIIVAGQTNYFFSKNLGFNKEYIITAQLPRDWSPEGVQKILAAKKQMSSIPQVSAATIAYEIQDGNSSGNTQIFKYGGDSANAITAQLLTTDEDYVKTYAISMLAGSYFTMSPADTFKLVINETLAQAMGYKNPEDAVGQKMKLQGSQPDWIISGVSNDFHFGSIQQQIKPAVMMNVLANPIYRYISIKVKPGNLTAGVEAIQQQWRRVLPSAPFEYSFMDDKLAALYKNELQLKKAAITATGLALLIVLLGVVGLVALSIQKRIREIGIRRVLGSSAAGIVQLFIKEFLAVMAFAVIAVCPLILLVMQNWLNTYAYRITLNAWPFITGAAVVSGLTILLISFQTWRAAWMNPVKSLKTDS